MLLSFITVYFALSLQIHYKLKSPVFSTFFCTVYPLTQSSDHNMLIPEVI